MKPQLFRALLLFALASPALAACAGRSGNSLRASAPRRLGMDRPVLPLIPRSDRRVMMDAEVTVMIDIDSTADMLTLKITGRAASLYFQALSDWVERGRYEPAKTSNGELVRGQFRYFVRDPRGERR